MLRRPHLVPRYILVLSLLHAWTLKLSARLIPYLLQIYPSNFATSTPLESSNNPTEIHHFCSLNPITVIQHGLFD